MKKYAPLMHCSSLKKCTCLGSLICLLSNHCVTQPNNDGKVTIGSQQYDNLIQNCFCHCQDSNKHVYHISRVLKHHLWRSSCSLLMTHTGLTFLLLLLVVFFTYEVKEPILNCHRLLTSVEGEKFHGQEGEIALNRAGREISG